MNIKKAEILLVEDNPDDLMLAKRALEKNQLSNKVHIVNNGEEALDFLFSRNDYFEKSNINNLRLILLDLKLPKVDGFEVLSELKKNDKTKNIPVVIMTSSKQESDILQGYQLGANSYIIKPLEYDCFIKTIGDIGAYWLLYNKLPEL